MTVIDTTTADTRRQDRNRKRRDQRRVEGRLRMARHAARELVTYGAWDGDRPTATAQDVIRQTGAMYGGYLKGVDITPEEAAVALRVVLTCDSYEESQAELRKAARRILDA
ncbi:hypothetical protein [Streptomyces hypolithicus]